MNVCENVIAKNWNSSSVDCIDGIGTIIILNTETHTHTLTERKKPFASSFFYSLMKRVSLWGRLWVLFFSIYSHMLCKNRVLQHFYGECISFGTLTKNTILLTYISFDFFSHNFHSPRSFFLCTGTYILCSQKERCTYIKCKSKQMFAKYITLLLYFLCTQLEFLSFSYSS